MTLQNRERTGVPARAARVGWWMRAGSGLNLGDSAVSPETLSWVGPLNLYPARYCSRFCNADAIQSIIGLATYLFCAESASSNV